MYMYVLAEIRLLNQPNTTNKFHDKRRNHDTYVSAPQKVGREVMQIDGTMRSRLLVGNVDREINRSRTSTRTVCQCGRLGERNRMYDCLLALVTNSYEY